jgi:hypothetical protein
MVLTKMFLSRASPSACSSEILGSCSAPSLPATKMILSEFWSWSHAMSRAASCTRARDVLAAAVGAQGEQLGIDRIEVGGELGVLAHPTAARIVAVVAIGDEADADGGLRLGAGEQLTTSHSLARAPSMRPSIEDEVSRAMTRSTFLARGRWDGVVFGLPASAAEGAEQDGQGGEEGGAHGGWNAGGGRRIYENVVVLAR